MREGKGIFPCQHLTEKFHHSVYVILLGAGGCGASVDSALQFKSEIQRMPCVYVGMTGLLVEHRFENHKKGYKSAWTVKKYGVRLMPELLRLRR